MPLMILALLSALGNFHSEVGLGGDYSSQRFSLFGFDTLTAPVETVVTETQGRSFWNLTYNAKSRNGRFSAGNRFSLTTIFYRDQFRLDLEQNLTDRLNLTAGYDGETHNYLAILSSGSDTSLHHDHFDNSAWLGLEVTTAHGLSFGMRENATYQHYYHPDSFFFRAWFNRVGLSSSVNLGTLTTLDADYDWSRRWALGRSDLSYANHDLELSLNSYAWPNWNLQAGSGADRRSCPTRDRSYWEVSPSVNLTRTAGSVVSVSLADDARMDWFDSSTTFYHNQLENAVRLSFEVKYRSRLTLRLGPQFDYAYGVPGPSSDDYRDNALVGSLDYVIPGRLFIMTEDQLGIRDYPFAESMGGSSYRYNQLNLTVNWTILRTHSGNLNLSGSVDISPEWHAHKADNLAASVYSLDLRYSF